MDITNEQYQERLGRFFTSVLDVYKKEKEDYNQRLKRFFEPLVFKYRVAKEIKAQTDRFLASDFNLVEIMKPDENKISDLIALLLEPGGVHGQGEKFFDLFLRHLKEQSEKTTPPERWEDYSVKVMREESTEQNRRIDIVIEMVREDEKFCIGIENKLWAGEQDEQLNDYVEDLKKRSKSENEEKFLMVYLDALAREPKTISNAKELEKDGKFMKCDYSRFLKGWLSDCYKECESEKVRWFLRDFMEWINENYKGAYDE